MMLSPIHFGNTIVVKPQRGQRTDAKLSRFLKQPGTTLANLMGHGVNQWPSGQTDVVRISGGKGVKVTKDPKTAKPSVKLRRPTNDGLVVNGVPKNAQYSMNRGQDFRDTVLMHHHTASVKMDGFYRQPKSGNEALVVSISNSDWKKLPQAVRRSLMKEVASKTESYESFVLPADQVMRFESPFQAGREILPIQVDGHLANLARPKTKRYFRFEAPKGKGAVDSVLKMIKALQGPDKKPLVAASKFPTHSQPLKELSL